MVRKFKKLITIPVFSILFSTLLFCAVLWTPETVNAEVYYVYDEADLLSDTEEEELDNQIYSLIETTGWNIYAVTIDDAQGFSAAAFADAVYEDWAGIDTDGFLVLIDMDNREIYLSTSGIAIRYLYDERVDNVLDAGYAYVSNGEYAACLSEMIRSAEYYYGEGIPEDQYNYDVETGAISRYRTLTWMEAVPVLLLAALAGIGIYKGISKSYVLNGTDYEYQYSRYGNVNLTKQEDHFIRQSVIHHRIQTNSGGGTHGGGGNHRSSTHRSSGGGTHGGGGRRF